MRRLLLLLLLVPVLPAWGAPAEPLHATDRDSLPDPIDIERVEVVGHRPLKRIGMQESRLDDGTLHDHIAAQMADALKFSTAVFVKEYGRATLSTVSFRGTSPSHTQVTWNGMSLNSPMLGMTDFSTIPTYLVDQASLLHGTSSVSITGGGLGGAVQLATRPAEAEGFNLQYTQGIGSFCTFDEFLRLGYGNDRWQLSTRAVYASSKNNFKYTNYKKKEHIYDENHQIIGSYYPVERNRSGDYNDLHLLQDAYYNAGRGHRIGLSAWYFHSRRGVPMLSTDRRDESDYTNEQRERTFRGVVSWDWLQNDFKVAARAGYIHSRVGYDHSRRLSDDLWTSLIDSHSRVNTLYGSVEGEYTLGKQWLFTARLTLHRHHVVSSEQQGVQGSAGFDRARTELSGLLSAKWHPIETFGLGLTLREEMYGGEWCPVVPALFTDLVLSKRGNVIAKASVSRNIRYPSLNDLYFLPSGNPDLTYEQGFSYDCGVEFTVGREGQYKVHGEATWFDSRIDDWIVWLPTFQGFWRPENIRRVHAYGVELRGQAEVQLARDWRLSLTANYAWTPSINEGDPTSWSDQAIGKQLVYVPLHSAAATARIEFRTWALDYKWCYYSERFTTSSNTTATQFGRVMPYNLSDLALEKRFTPRWADLSLKGVVKNLFNTEYESVLARPMPGIHFELFLEIRPQWGKNSNR